MTTLEVTDAETDEPVGGRHATVNDPDAASPAKKLAAQIAFGLVGLALLSGFIFTPKVRSTVILAVAAVGITGGVWIGATCSSTKRPSAGRPSTRLVSVSPHSLSPGSSLATASPTTAVKEDSLPTWSTGSDCHY